MAVETPALKIDPYTSTVPLVQIPQQELEQQQRPAANYMGKAGGIAEIANGAFSGLLKGLQMKEKKKFDTAQTTIEGLDRNTDAAWQTYQQALAQGKAKQDASDPLYAAYLDSFTKSKEAKKQFIIPEKNDGKGKGQSSSVDGTGKKRAKDKSEATPGGFGAGLKQFFERNPHIIPEITLLGMQPKPPGATTDTTETQNRLQEQKNTLTSQGQNIEQNSMALAETKRQQEFSVQKQKVDEAGGADAVLKSKDAPPELQKTARMVVAERLDKESVDGQMRDQFAKDVMSGNSKTWSPDQRKLAANLGYATAPKPQEIEKGGKRYQVLIDPDTNQPVAGSTPLYVGPSSASETMGIFNAQRNAVKNDIKDAVARSPQSYGFTPTGNPNVDKPQIDAIASRLYVQHETGIASLSESTGKSANEVQRDDLWLKDVTGAMKLEAKEGGSPFDGKNDKIIYPGGKEVIVDRAKAKEIRDEFVQNSQGIWTFRDTVNNPANKSPEELEADRKYFQKFVQNRGEVLTGKKELGLDKSDAILKGKALGKPISAQTSSPEKPASGGLSKPSFMQKLFYPYAEGGAKPENVGGGMAKPGGELSYANESFAGSSQWRITDAEGNSMGYNMTPQQADYMKQQGYKVEPAQ